MPYLSKIPLNPRRRSAHAFLTNPHRLHAAIQAGLTIQPVTERTLWRLDSNTAHRADVLVLTQSRPSWEHLVEQAGWPGADDGQPLIADYGPLLQRLAVGREFAFRLTANPTQSVERPQRPSDEQTARLKERTDAPGAEKVRQRGFRVPHRTAAQQLAWLINRTERHGFTIPAAPVTDPAPGLDHDEPQTPAPAVALTDRGTLRFRKHRDGPQITVSTATFQGRLRVTHADALRTALLHGIGPAKGYGQGLLTLAPLPEEHEERAHV